MDVKTSKDCLRIINNLESLGIDKCMIMALRGEVYSKHEAYKRVMKEQSHLTA